MQRDCSSILLISMPFAGVEIPSIQLALLESYLKERDVEIETRHLYLKAADFYGLKNYNTLIHPPNDSYTSQMVFSKYVFPDHWEKNIERFKEYYNRISKEQTFEEYVKKTDNFYNFVISNIDWGRYDIIGFTLNYGQFLPSLAVAKKIKEFYPNKKIVFGGSRTTGELGINTLKIFPYVDFVVSGEGEEALYRLSIQSANYDQIPNLIYRKDGEIVFNNTTSQMNLNLLPIPLYDDFYKELNSVSAILKEYFSYQGRLPVEISRGCWWNKCTFCNLNIQYKGYREKDVDRIVEEIDFLSDKYEILSFHIVSNILLLKNMGVLCKKLMELGKDFSFFAETRAGRLKSFDYALLKKAGFNVIQTGIESFSSSYLKKMNKGVGVIDNIAALKFCMENGITNEYNLIVDYPNEELIDFEETRRNVELIEDYIDPPNLCNLRVLYGSPIYCNRERFGIKELDFFEIDKIMFPREILEKGISFVYSFKVKEKSYSWEDLINRWRIRREGIKMKGVKSRNLADTLVFYFIDGRRFLKIYDKRGDGDLRIYVLDEEERAIFLACQDVVSYEKLQKRFPEIPDYKLAAILYAMEENGLVFREGNRYLSLPLRAYPRFSDLDKDEKAILGNELNAIYS
ncbi:MAG: hypothetical protein DRN12_02770, partial [Thermoplasmata archaeon]